MVPAKSEPLPEVPAEVRAFAEQEGVTAYLPAVLEMTRRIFPAAPLRMFVEDDPEIPDDRHLVLKVELSGLDAQQLFEAQRRWTGDIFRHCPATHVPVFRIRMVPPA
jgi:hypothetical protein